MTLVEPPVKSFDTADKAIETAMINDKKRKDSITKDLFAIKLLHSWKCPGCQKDQFEGRIVVSLDQIKPANATFDTAMFSSTVLKANNCACGNRIKVN